MLDKLGESFFVGLAIALGLALAGCLLWGFVGFLIEYPIPAVIIATLVVFFTCVGYFVTKRWDEEDDARGTKRGRGNDIWSDGFH